MTNATDLLEFEDYLDEAPEEASIEEGPRIPHLTWKYGDAAMARLKESVAYRGGWFLAADTIDRFDIDTETLAAVGFVEDMFVDGKGNEIEGWSAPVISIQRIHERRRWVTRELGPVTWSEGFDYKGKKRPHLHVLALIKGLEEYGPFVLTMKGSAEMKWFGAGLFKGEGVEEEMRATLIASANRIVAQMRKAAGKKKAKKSYHYMAFSVPVGVKWVTTGKGKSEKTAPEFVEVGLGDDTTMVVVPNVTPGEEVELSNQMDAEELAPFMAAKDAYYKAIEVFEDFKEWQAAWDDIEAVRQRAEDDAQEEAESVGMDETEAVELDDLEL